jgi:Uma2 family endonuclease
MNNPSFREKLESQIESAEGKIEIFDGFIVRCMPESNRKMFISSIFSENYGGWARQQGGKFGVGNGGITLGNTMRAPDGTFYRNGNVPPSTQAMLSPTLHPDWILETEFEHSMVAAETKIIIHWLANGVYEAWLLVIPNLTVCVGPAPVAPPPVSVVEMTQDRPDVPYIAIYCSATHPRHLQLPNPLNPLQGYFPIGWHSEFQPPAWSLLSGAPPINCDCFMEELC